MKYRIKGKTGVDDFNPICESDIISHKKNYNFCLGFFLNWIKNEL